MFTIVINFYRSFLKLLVLSSKFYHLVISHQPNPKPTHDFSKILRRKSLLLIAQMELIPSMTGLDGFYHSRIAKVMRRMQTPPTRIVPLKHDMIHDGDSNEYEDLFSENVNHVFDLCLCIMN